MSGCISQWYLCFPALLKVCVYLCPLPKRPESNDLFLLAVAVWAVLSLLIHLTFVPRLMVMWAGLKLKFLITTVLVGCFCAMAVGCLCAPATDTANSVPTTTSVATVINKMMRLISVTSSFSFSGPTAEHLCIRLYPKTARLSKIWAQASCTRASQFSAFFDQRVRRLRRLTNHEIVRSTIHRLAG